jgi:hypothetical protein
MIRLLRWWWTELLRRHDNGSGRTGDGIGAERRGAGLRRDRPRRSTNKPVAQNGWGLGGCPGHLARPRWCSAGFPNLTTVFRLVIDLSQCRCRSFTDCLSGIAIAAATFMRCSFVLRDKFAWARAEHKELAPWERKRKRKRRRRRSETSVFVMRQTAEHRFGRLSFLLESSSAFLSL